MEPSTRLSVTSMLLRLALGDWTEPEPFKGSSPAEWVLAGADRPPHSHVRRTVD